MSIPLNPMQLETGRRCAALNPDACRAAARADLEREVRDLKAQLSKMTEDRDAWKRAADTWDHAWVRELGRWGGRFYHWGHHRIDVLVVSTQKMRECADAYERVERAVVLPPEGSVDLETWVHEVRLEGRDVVVPVSWLAHLCKLTGWRWAP